MRDAVDAKLVRPAGERLQFEPGQLLGGIVQRLIIGDGAGAVGVVAVGRRGALSTGSADTFQRQVDAALDRDRSAGDDRPVGLVDVTAAEQRGELAGSARRAGKQQNAGGIAIQPVDQAGPVFGAEPQRVQHAVEVAGDAGAPLHRQAVGLVDHQDLVVLVDDRLLQVLGVVRIDPADGFGREPGHPWAGSPPTARRRGGCWCRPWPRRRGSGRCGRISG